MLAAFIIFKNNKNKYLETLNDFIIKIMAYFKF
jgi:hypothetical protein